MPINKKQKELLKIFAFLLTFLLIVFNWSNVAWLFNYKEVSGLISGFFNPYPESVVLSEKTANNNIVPNYQYSGKSNSIEIPTLDIDVPIVIGKSTDLEALEDDLNKGVVYYPGSVAPGQNGHIAMLGHSAPPNWPKIKYDWVFSNINNLVLGDKIYVNFNGKKYIYIVYNKQIVQKGGEIELNGEEVSNNVLSLISCWPPGKNYQRIAVQAKIVRN